MRAGNIAIEPSYVQYRGEMVTVAPKAHKVKRPRRCAIKQNSYVVWGGGRRRIRFFLLKIARIIDVDLSVTHDYVTCL